jgi:hypothetical protein
MGRSLVFLLSSAVLASAAGGAAAQTAQPAASAASAPSQPVAVMPGTDVGTLICDGTYAAPASGSTPATERATQFTLQLSYSGNYMELKAGEWPSLLPWKDNPSVVRSIRFTYDDNQVTAMFPAAGSEIRGKLVSWGLSEIAGDYKEVIVLDRKTGAFTYPNTTGTCRKVEAKENKF